MGTTLSALTWAVCVHFWRANPILNPSLAAFEGCSLTRQLWKDSMVILVAEDLGKSVQCPQAVRFRAGHQASALLHCLSAAVRW